MALGKTDSHMVRIPFSPTSRLFYFNFNMKMKEQM